MNIPVRIISPFEHVDATWPSDNCCDLCCAVPVVGVIEGDKMCRRCRNDWIEADARPGDHLLPMSHPVMREASRKYQAADDAVGRLIADLAKGQRRFQRDFK
jgi:hypothetical protein